MRYFRIALAIFLSVVVFTSVEAAAPRLVVVVSVDQLKQSYLSRFEELFDDDGIYRRVQKEGARFINCHHQHAFTFTGPGHSVLLTGAYPRDTAIIGNEWFSPELNRQLYCVEDSSAKIVGLPGAQGDSSGVKKISPRNLTAETVGDVLQNKTDGKSKVIGLALKDRAGVLMAGRNADAAYWFVNRHWVTSDYYMDRLPRYIHGFNECRMIERHAGRCWDLCHSRHEYTLYRPDDYPHEDERYGLGRCFPHHTANCDSSEFEKQLPITPFGTEFTLEMARLLIEYEDLGQDEVTDMLCIGLSSNDYVGHAFGPYSLEVEDITLRTDKMLGHFAKFLDATVGQDKWVMAITSDHGVGPLPEFINELGFQRKRNPLGDASLDQLHRQLEAQVRAALGPPPANEQYVLEVETSQVYLNRNPEVLSTSQRDLAISVVRRALQDIDAVFTTISLEEALAAADSEDPILRKVYNSAHASRSGDVLFILRPFFMQSRAAATHGSPWAYDSHVPLMWLGSGVRPGKHVEPVSPAQIAPTLSKLLKIENPADCVETRLPHYADAQD